MKRIDKFEEGNITESEARLQFDVLYGHIDKDGNIWAERNGTPLCFDEWINERVFD